MFTQPSEHIMTFHIPDQSQAAWCRGVAAELATPEFQAKMADCFLNSKPTATAGSAFRLTRESLREWILSGMRAASERGFVPQAVDRDVPLEEAVAAFNRPKLPGEWVFVPVSTVGNDPDPSLLTPSENIMFRFLHDWLHAVIGADATFEGELALTLGHICSAAPNSLLFPVFTSEVLGQAAVATLTGEFPEQRLMGACWNVLWLELADLMGV
jgi:hypothetical protein